MEVCDACFETTDVAANGPTRVSFTNEIGQIVPST